MHPFTVQIATQIVEERVSGATLARRSLRRRRLFARRERRAPLAARLGITGATL